MLYEVITLGARDTLRLEAGLALYGQEMDEQISPLAANLGWTLAWTPGERNFVGREALEQARNQPSTAQLVGLLLEDRGVLRAGMAVFPRITSYNVCYTKLLRI